jgi:hypothetical protein
MRACLASCSIVVALVLFLALRGGHATATVGLALPAVDIGKLARQWEPELYDELGTNGAPPKFEAQFKSPCFHAADGALRCVPGAYVLGG